MKKIIYIHPGYPKSATSFIQRKFFSTHHMINNIGKKESINDIDKDLLNVFRQIMFKKNIDQNEFIKIKNVISSIKYDPDRINLISFEGFTQLNFEVGLEKIFRRIKKIFYESNYQVKILVTIRAQLSMIPTHYANTGKTYKKGCNRWKSFKNFINDLENINKFQEERLLIAYNRYNYFKLLNTLNEIFSKGNVKFFIYEELLLNQKKYFDDMADFLKIQNNIVDYNLLPVNVTSKKGDKLRRINKYYLRNLKFVPKLLKNLKLPHKEFLRNLVANFYLDTKYFFDPVKLNNNQKTTILNYYSKNNELLSNSLNKDLKSLGY